MPINLGHQMEVGPLVGSGILSYNKPVVSARTEPGQAAAPYAIGSYSKYTDTIHPNTGNLIKGWQWDNRVWSEESVENYAAEVPINWDPTTEGITRSYFQSGIGSNTDLKIQDVIDVPSEGLNELKVFSVWAPEIEHGYYYDFEVQDYLYSDDSEVLFFSYDGVSDSGFVTESGFNEIPLSQRPKVSVPIQVRQMEWDNQIGKYNVYKSLQKKVFFSGNRDENGARVSTYDANTETILWDDIDKSLDEFVVVASGENTFKVILNDQYIEGVGIGNVPGDLEFVGYSNGKAGQQFHTVYSPIDSTQETKVYSYLTVGGPTTEWTPVPFDQTPVGYQVKFDYDLGILEFGDPSEAGQLIPAAGHSIGVSYYKTFYLEYEPDYTKNTIVATETNLNPIYRKSSRGFVYLATQLEDPAVVELEAILPATGKDSYGPLSIGGAHSPLVATVKDSKGQLLESQTVKFYITSDPIAGSFSGFSELEITSVTDEYGEARSYYNSPRSINDIGENVLAANWSQGGGNTTLRTETILIEGGTDDIFLYGTYVDDPLQGLWDYSLANNSNVQLDNYYEGYFDEHEIEGGTRDIEWETMHREAWQFATPVLFSNVVNGGRKKIVAAFDSTALNPHSFEVGAIVPVQPTSIVSYGGGVYDLIFDTSVNDIPQPTASLPSPSGTLYSYFVIAPTKVKIQASVFNKRLNQEVLSNEIDIKLSIPSYMNGLWILDAINESQISEISAALASVTVNNQKVPLGFRLKSSRVTLAAALDGVTFLDMNRAVPVQSTAYDPYDPDNLDNVRLAHQVNVSGVDN